jgi:hypothetical protein
MANKLTKNYKPRIKFNSKHPISHPENKPYVEALAKFFMERIKQSAKPYHLKHKGVKNSGLSGKIVTVTLEQLEQTIIKSNGKSPDGVSIHFAPVGILKVPNDAEKFGLVTSEERSRFPSIDRIISSIGYEPDNIQLTTKKYNLGKSTDVDTKTTTSGVSLKWNGIDIELSNVTASFLADTLKELAK